jgi:GNAT superfamily N-acetyltransferase
MALVLRDATAADGELIAWVQVEAARSGTPLGFWDLALPGPDDPRLRIVAEIATTGREHFAHVSGFLVAELDGEPVGALSGYAPGKKKIGYFAGALDGALERSGWSDAHRRLLFLRIAPAESCFSETPEDCWIVEWVALRPNVRGKGIAGKLLDAILQRGRDDSFKKAQISYLIGNTPAKRAYERAGFVAVDEKRAPEFEAVFGAPGTVRMRREL